MENISHSALLLRAKFGVLNFTSKQAKAEAKARLRDNHKINDAEFAYSPSTQAVGMRWREDTYFRVFNVCYPMYGRSDEVTDWHPVGKGTKKD